MVDGQAQGMPPLVEVHNPTDKNITTTLTSPPNTPLFGKVTAEVTVLAGDSLYLVLRDNKLVPRE